MSSHAGDSYSELPLSLLSWCLNLFRLAQSANVRIPQWHFPCFIFPWTLTGVPAVSYISRLPSFHVNCHATGDAVLTWKPSPTQTTKGALDSKMLLPVHKTSGSIESDFFLWRNLLCPCGRKPVSLFPQVAPHLEAPAAGERGSGRADGWMHCGWWKSLLPIHILQEELAYWSH